MKKTGRTEKMTLVANPELKRAFFLKCADMKLSPSACVEIWMMAIVDSENAMAHFERLFNLCLDLESARRKPT